MSALVAAELLKFRTTRTSIGVLLVALGLVALAAAGTVGTAEDTALGTSQLTQDIVSSALFASLVAFIVGILSVTVEWRHGTVTRTFLVTPRRGRIVPGEADRIERAQVAGVDQAARLAVPGVKAPLEAQLERQAACLDLGNQVDGLGQVAGERLLTERGAAGLDRAPDEPAVQ